jgi:chemotaxis protein histidine kinase CheA/DNA-binding NarL/FixJ family response regulator
MVGDRVANETPVASLAALAEEIERDLSSLALSLREPSVVSIDPAPLIDAARRLVQVQGALLLIDQEGLAALTQLVRDQLITSGQHATTPQYSSYLIVQQLHQMMRQALANCLRGQTLTAGDLLRCWHQQLAIGGPSILQPSMLVAIDIDPNAVAGLPPPEVTDQLPPDPDQSLLKLLRAQDDLDLREAAKQIAALFTQAAARFKQRNERYYWQAVQACLLEYAIAGGDTAPIKKIAAAGVRLLRQRDHQSTASAGASLRSVTRDALFELAQRPLQRPLQTALARAVVKLFRIDQQFAEPSNGIATDSAIDEGFAAWTSALDKMISTIETNPACIVDPSAWNALVDTANTWASLSPVADLLKDLVAQIASRSDEPIHAEGIAAGLCCLRASGDLNALRVAIQTMKQLLSSTEPRQCLNQLGQWSRAENTHRLFVALISAMRSDMTQVEHLLDAEPPAEAATTLKVVVAVLTRIAGALQLLGLIDELERVIKLRDVLGQKNTATWMDETFPQQWVLLQTMLAQLPWQKMLQARQSSAQACGLDSIFIEEARALMEVMREYAAASDRAGMAQTAHTLGGCSATVGLSGLAELSLALESTLEQLLARGAVLDDVLLDTVLTTLACVLEDFASHGVRGDASELVQCLREYSVVPGANDTVETLDLTIDPFAQQEAETILIETLDEPVIDTLQYTVHSVSESIELSEPGESSEASESGESGESGEALAEIGVASSPSISSSISPSSSPSTSAAALTTEKNISSNQSDEEDELYEIFKLEAADLLPQLEQSLRQWQLHPEDGSQAAQLLRVLHTLKGSARMAGRDDLGAEFHHAEAEVSALLQQAQNGRAPAIAALLHRVDFWIYGLTQTADALSGLKQTNQPTAITELADTTQVAEQRQPLEASVAPQQDSGSDNSASPVTSNAEKRWPMLRVRADRLAQFADTGAEIWSSNATLREVLQEQRRSFADLSDDLSRLRAQLRELEIEAESRVLARASQGVSTDFDPLEFDRYTRLHELTRMMAESITDVVGVQRGLASQLERLTTAAAEQLRDLRRQQSELQALRSQPLHSVEARLRHVLRQAAGEIACEVGLELHHGSVEIERVLLDRLLGPLEHLLRNSVVHGIEQAQQRLSLGKSETGRVMISAALTGNELQLTVQDDGRGLDLQRIRQRAVEAGLLQADDDLDERALSALIFAPGLSTATEVTALSGRGIGMDAVRAELHALGGQIEVESEAGQGCRFTLRVPMGLASVMVVLVRAGQWRIGLPAALVKQALQIDVAKIRSDAQQQIEWQGTTLPLRHLSQTLGDTTAPITKGRVPVVVLSDGEKTIALQLDAIEGQRELIVKHPGPQLSRVPGLAGASVLADGTIALIIHPFRLPETTSATALSSSPASEQLSTVLVVDDSLTVRRASQRLLERHGYAVALARDGVEALAYLGNDRPALILLDIEMPRMDGFELLATLRDDTRWCDIPVVMITSRMADRHRERAMQLGANAYMGKPYREDALLALLSEILADKHSSKIVSGIATSNTINIATKTAPNAATNISINTATEIDSMTNMPAVIASN